MTPLLRPRRLLIHIESPKAVLWAGTHLPINLGYRLNRWGPIFLSYSDIPLATPIPGHAEDCDLGGGRLAFTISNHHGGRLEQQPDAASLITRAIVIARAHVPDFDWLITPVEHVNMLVSYE